MASGEVTHTWAGMSQLGEFSSLIAEMHKNVRKEIVKQRIFAAGTTRQIGVFLSAKVRFS